MNMKRILLLLLLFTVYASGSDKEKIQQLINDFVEKETLFRDIWGQYTYTQNVTFEVIGAGDRVTERRVMVIEVYFTADGKRQTRIVEDRGQLRSLRVTPEDIENAVELQPFVLTRDELPDYKVEYIGPERVDELETYVFDLKPRKMKKGRRYFQGRAWVDRLDKQIVMTRGKVVPDEKDNIFPKFETVREQIDGEYWFPTWSEADDYINTVHLRQLITFENFKKFGVSATIKYGEEAKKDPDPR